MNFLRRFEAITLLNLSSYWIRKMTAAEEAAEVILVNAAKVAGCLNHVVGFKYKSHGSVIFNMK